MRFANLLLPVVAEVEKLANQVACVSVSVSVSVSVCLCLCTIYIYTYMYIYSYIDRYVYLEIYIQ